MKKMPKTIDVDVSQFGIPNINLVKLKKITAGERSKVFNELARKCNLKMKGSDTVGDAYYGDYPLLYLSYCICGGDIDNKLSTIEDLDCDLVDFLYEKAEELNSPLASQKQE